MIVLKLLSLYDFYNVSLNVEIAKGKYKMPVTLKEGAKQIKRAYKWQEKK